MQPTQQQLRPATTETEASRLLDQILDKAPSSRYRLINDALERRIASVEEVLPDGMKGQAARLVKRAMMTFARRPELAECPPAEFIRCVIEAAEIGLAIDGKLCYVVRYKNAWQMQPDYKGLIAVAKRSGQIKDCYADVICEMDRFEHRREDGGSHIIHTYELGSERGEVIGAYAVVILPDGRWRYELMDRNDLDRIQALAPAQRGPWSTHPNEMRKKTAIRRCLKLYCDDPAVIRCTEFMDREFEEQAQNANGPPIGRGPLRALRSEPAPPPETEQGSFRKPESAAPADDEGGAIVMPMEVLDKPEPIRQREPGEDDESAEEQSGFSSQLEGSIAFEEERQELIRGFEQRINMAKLAITLSTIQGQLLEHAKQLGPDFERLNRTVEQKLKALMPARRK
jgi:phage RecT family recombinase